MDNRLIAKIARKGGAKLLDMAIDRVLRQQPEPFAKPASEPVAASVTRASVTRKVTTATLGNVARRSVPAAILIGGAVLAKTLHDKRKARKATAAAGDAAEQDGDAEA